MSIDAETPLSAVLCSEGTMKVLARHGFHAISCPSELFLPLRAIAQSREIPIDRLLTDLQSVGV